MPLQSLLTSKLSPKTASIGRLPLLVYCKAVQCWSTLRNMCISVLLIPLLPRLYFRLPISLTLSILLTPLVLVFQLCVLFLSLLRFSSFFHIYIYISFHYIFTLFYFTFLRSLYISPFLVYFIYLPARGICLWPHWT